MKLPEYFKNISEFSPESELTISAVSQREEFPKGHLLFRQDEICNRIFFIEKGFARTYNISDSGREITNWFFSENSFLTAVNSFYNGGLSGEYCVLMENSVVYSIKYSEFEMILDKHLELGKFCFFILFEIAKQMTDYINSSKFQTAEERYHELIKRYPSMLQRASLGQIASFLGITQETLSRIRSKK